MGTDLSSDAKKVLGCFNGYPLTGLKIMVRLGWSENDTILVLRIMRERGLLDWRSDLDSQAAKHDEILCYWEPIKVSVSHNKSDP